MANTLLTPSIIAKEALMVLESQLTMAGLVHRDYSDEFANVGDTVTARKPARFVAKNFTGTVVNQDITETSVPVKLDRFRDVTVAVSSKELSLTIQDFSTQVVTPALMAIAQAVDTDLLAVGVAMAAKSATVSATPVISDIAGVGKALDISKAPRTDRRLMLPPSILYKYNTLDNFSKVVNMGTSDALQNSNLGMVYSCDTYMTQNAPENASATPGTVTAYSVVGTAGANTFTVSAGTPTTGTILTGDKLIVGGYIYTVTADTTLVSGAGTITVDQNIPATIASATAVKIINKAHALGFHRNGLALVTRQLALPLGNQNASIASANGLAVRVVMDYNSSTKTDTISFDILYGVKELDTSLLVDFS